MKGLTCKFILLRIILDLESTKLCGSLSVEGMLREKSKNSRDFPKMNTWIMKPVTDTGVSESDKSILRRLADV